MPTVRILLDSGYQPPGAPTDVTSVSKKEAVDAVQSVVIEQIDSEGEAIETWTLTNAFITKVNYGGKLEYGQEGLTTMSVEFRYDWASITTSGKADPGPGQFDPAPGLNKYWAPGQTYD